MNDSIPNISLYKFIFHLEALEDMRLPEYKGSMFRGAFGWSFRKPVCVTGKPNCDRCILQTQCTYFKVFETEVSGHNIPFLKGVKKVPHPFVIHPQLSNKTDFKKGEIIKVGLTIFGDTINYFPYFVYTFQQMGKIGIGHKLKKYRMLSVYNLNSEGNEFVVFNHVDQKLTTSYQKIDNSTILKKRTDKNKITINFVTPLRLQEQSKRITEPTTTENIENEIKRTKSKSEAISDPNLITPTLLIRNIERRIIVVSNFFCGSGCTELFTGIDNDLTISENQLKFYSWERYSSKQKKKNDLGGFTGKITMEGNIDKFSKLLLIGEKLNIGKNTVFGLGEYLIE